MLTSSTDKTLSSLTFAMSLPSESKSKHVKTSKEIHIRPDLLDRIYFYVSSPILLSSKAEHYCMSHRFEISGMRSFDSKESGQKVAFLHCKQLILGPHRLIRNLKSGFSHMILTPRFLPDIS